MRRPALVNGTPSRIRWLLAAAALAVFFALMSFAATEPVSGDEVLGEGGVPGLIPQAGPYNASVEDIRISSSPVYEGEATIFVDVLNRSSAGEATFDVRLEVDPPGFSNTVYPADDDDDWDDVSFARNGRVTLSKSYTFARTLPGTRYRMKAEVYNNGGKENGWSSGRRFDDATRSENFSVNAVTYDAKAQNVQVSSSDVSQGDTVTISATFTNQVRSNSGDGTFDIAFVVVPPSGSQEELEFTGSSDRTFTKNQSKVLRKSYRFQQEGTHTIKARIWNPDRSEMFGESETELEVKSPYSAEIADIRISSSPLYEGEATILVDVVNRSSRNGPDGGAATFDVRLEVDSPGSGNTVYPADDDDDWNNVSFARNGRVTLSKSYTFARTLPGTRYRMKAEVYNNGGKEAGWLAEDRFDDATRSENFSVNAVTYDAKAQNVQVSSSDVSQGDTVTISATFTNQVRSNSGDGTFDIAFVVVPPSGSQEELEFTGSSDRTFTKNQSKVLRKSYRFQQEGTHTIKARIWNPDRSEMFGESETELEVKSPYSAEIADIRISSSPLYEGEATILVDVVNRSSRNGPDGGAATFDVRLEVDPPGSGNTVYPADDDDDWNNVSFGRNETVTLSKKYDFAQSTGQHTRYRLKAEVYGINGKENNWHSDHLFGSATGSEEFQVEALPDPPDLAIEIAEQVTPIVGKPLTVPLVLKNKGTSASPEYNIRVVLGEPNAGAVLGTASSLVPTGGEAVAGPLMRSGLIADYGLIFPSITNGLKPGGHLLCVVIEYIGDTADGEDSDNADCRAVYVLPNMVGDFPGELQAFLHLDDHIQHKIDIDIDLRRNPGIDIASKLLSGEEIQAEDVVVDSNIASTMGLAVLGGLGGAVRLKGDIGTGSEPFWILVPTEYSTRYQDGELKEEVEELGKEIVERTWGGLESRDDRENAYQKLSLEIARRGQTYGNKFVSVGVTEKDREKFEEAVKLLKDKGINELPENIETLIDLGKEVVEAAELLEKVLSEVQVDPKFVQLETLHAHLEHLPLHNISNGLVAAKVVVKTVGLAGDIRITESLNRTIFVGQATHTLELLEDLNVDDAAWNPAILEAQSKLKEMTSEDGLQSWSAAIEDNLPNIAATYSQLALQIAAAKLASFAVGTVLTAAGVASLPVTIIAVPVSIAAAWVISEIYRISNETHKWWDGVTLASMSAQVYSHVHTALAEGGQDEADRIAAEEIRDYLKFAYYKHLGRAAEVDGTNILGDGGLTQDKLDEEKRAIFHERDEILSGVLGGDWDHTQDFKFLEDAHRPLAIWSDETTMWVMDGESASDYIVHAFDMSRKTPDEDKKLEFHPYSHLNEQTISDLWGADAGPRGIWGTDGTVWIADHDYLDGTIISGYRISDESKFFDIKAFEIPEEGLFTLPDAGLWSDGTTMWFSSWTGDCGIVAYDVEKQTRDFSKSICELAETNRRPYDLWSDGKTMWVSDIDEGRIFAYSVRSGEQEPGVPTWGEREILMEIVTVKVVDVTEDDYPAIADNSTPTGIWSDGETMWVADRESDRIFAYTLPDSLSPPLNLTATVSGTGGDSQVDLTWQAPSDTGRTAITGYVMEESENGLAWKQLVGSTASPATSYSDQRFLDWDVRHYRVAAINSAGVGPLSNAATVYKGINIAAISCSPVLFYAGDPVECSPTFVGDSAAEFTYAWQAKDGNPTWDKDGGSTASITWDTPGSKLLRVVVCRTGNPTDYINATLIDVRPADIDVGQASGGACAEATQTVRVADPTPRLAPGRRLPDDPIALGESVDLQFSITRTHWVGGPGGITVSFPDLTLANSGDGSAPYESSQGKITTISYSGNNSRIDYYDSGITGTVEDADGNDVQPSYLIVATDNDQWPPPIVPPERKLRLRVTPKEAGDFRILYRYWLCNEERQDGQGNPYCHQYPEPGDSGNGTLDQQGWAVREFTVTVVAPPVIESVGCGPGTVDVNNAVACTPSLSGGSPDEYTWTAGNVVAGGNPPSGSDATFSTSWSFSGRQTVSLRVCNDVSGCVSEKQTITVNADPTEPTVVVVPDMDEEEEEPKPSDGGRVLISGLASDWAHSSYSPTDTTIQVRALPTPDMPTLEITLYDEDGFVAAAGDHVSPGTLVLALPDDVRIDRGGITTELQIAGSWVDYTGELEKSLLALESISGGEQRTTATAQGLAPAAVGGDLTPPTHLAWGLGETGEAPADDIFGATYANCVSHATVAWLTLATQTTGVRISVPMDVSAEDYVSLALAAITAEGEDSEEPTLVQVHDLLETGDAAPGCEAP